MEENTGKFQESLESCRQAAGIEEELLARRPSDIDLRGDLASTYQNLAGAYLALGDWPHSEEQRRHVLQRIPGALPAAAGAAKPSSTAWPTPTIAWPISRSRPSTMPRPGRISSKPSGCSTCRRSGIPKDIRKRLDWTFAQQRLGSILISMGDLKGALDAFQKALPIREQLRALDPRDARAQINLANSHASIGYVLLEMGNALAARGHFEQQRKIDEELIKLDPMAVSHRYSLSEAYENLGRVANRLGAEAAGRRATERRAEDLRRIAVARSDLSGVRRSPRPHPKRTQRSEVGQASGLSRCLRINVLPYCAAITFCASLSIVSALGRFSTAFCTSGSSTNCARSEVFLSKARR